MMFKQRFWLALVALALWVIAACAAQSAPTPAAAPIGANDGSSVVEQLTIALTTRDYAALQAMMNDEFRLATWQGQGRILAPTEAIEEVRAFYIEPAYSPVVGDVSQATAALGADPLDFWSPQIDATSAILVQGLGVSGADEAVLITARAANGADRWAGMVVAPGGFPLVESVAASATVVASSAISAAPTTAAAEAQPESVAKVLILQTANVYAGPGASSGMVGLLSTGIVADVIAASSDGLWWRIVCPPGASGECWLSADTAVTRPVNTPAASTPVAATSQPIAPTATPLPPTATSTPTRSSPTATATRIPPTSTPQPASPERIIFAPGAISATRTGVIQPGQTKEYVIRVLAGQTMTIDLRSVDLAANFAVTGATDGQPYKRIVNEDRVWSFVTPATQDYLISIMTTAPVEYTLSVTIPPTVATPTPPAAPRRISFAPGESAATLTGTLGPNGQEGYLLRAVVGQTMFVALASAGDVANFAVSGYNSGQVLKPLSDPARTWSGRLPSTQDYLVTVVNPSSGSLGYSLVVSFSPLDRTPIPPPSQPQRISFPAGGTSATVGGPIGSGAVQNYVLRALAGQTMQVTVSSPADDVYLGVRGADGQIFLQFANGQRAWTGILPKNQDYLLSVYAAGGNTTYSLTVTVE